MKARPNGNNDKERREPNRVLPPFQARHISICGSPKITDLQDCPDGNATRQRPKHVISNLIPKEEFSIILGLTSVIKLPLIALQLIPIKPKMKPASNQRDQDHIPDPDLKYPPRC